MPRPKSFAIGRSASRIRLWLDALYEKVRIDGTVVSNAVVIAYGVTARGFRDVIAIDVVDTESKESWTTFLRGLRKRGLSGTKLVISDAHEGLKAAIATVMQGASWQRCTVHFYRNILAHVPQARKLEVTAALRTIFAQVSPEAAQRAASEFRALFGKTLTKAIAIFDAGLADALAFVCFPWSIIARLRPPTRSSISIKRSADVRAQSVSFRHGNPPCAS